MIGAVLVPGAKAPKLVTNSTVAHMKSGAVLVDIAIDQGGCFEDSRPTTHDDPTFAVHDTVFYCVANMPGAVPRTSTYALTNATMPYVVKLAERGWKAACQADSALAKGLSTHEGALLSEQVAVRSGAAVHRPGQRAGLIAQPNNSPSTYSQRRALTAKWDRSCSVPLRRFRR